MAQHNAPTTPSPAGRDPGNETGGRTGEQADTVGGVLTSAIGNRMEQAGDYLEDKKKAAFLSDRLHTAGRYLQENDVRSISQAVDSAICSHPYRAMLIGLGAGYVIGRLLRR
jgi:ElaB/YqjD/DUF883 family membrane-anchored ribosome-binding protein